jgi:hypothetical protein
VSWQGLEAGAPEIAHVARERLSAHGVALLGTNRPDGWPRISPVEPFFLEGELVFGLMPTPKLNDLRADPRCVLHSAVVDSSGSEPEAKLTGRAIRTRDPEILAADGTWWAARTDDVAAVFVLDIEEAAVVAWAPGFDRMLVSHWRRGQAPTERDRAYP